MKVNKGDWIEECILDENLNIIVSIGCKTCFNPIVANPNV